MKKGGDNSFFTQQLRQEVGIQADDLINKIRNEENYKPKFLLSVSLTFKKGALQQDRDKYMLELATKSSIHMDCFFANMIPTVIVRSFISAGEASEKKITVSGEVKEATLNTGDENQFKTDLESVLKKSYFVRFAQLIGINDHEMPMHGDIGNNVMVDKVIGLKEFVHTYACHYDRPVRLDALKGIKVYYLSKNGATDGVTKPSVQTVAIQIDPAMNTVRHIHTGGIDLTPALMSMQIKKEGEYFKFDFNGTEINATQVTGAIFTIRTMMPVKNVFLVLGLNQPSAIKSS